MTVMSSIEAKFCRSAPWRGFAGRVVLPWAIGDSQLSGHGLEIGGGSGAMAYELLRRLPDIRLTMVDLDPKMVSAANGRLASFADRADAALADATDLPFEDGSFDFVCSWLMLHHTIEWNEVVSECFRVLRPGGVFLGYDLTTSIPARWLHEADGSSHRLVSAEELQMELRNRPDAAAPSVEPALGGLVMRFVAQAS